MSRERGFTLIELLIVVAIIGIIAAIAIPSLLRARVSANESATIGDIRSVISAESTYASVNGYMYGQLSCLATPSLCIAGYPAGAPTFLDATMATDTQTKSGYARSVQYSGVSGSNVANFCYAAQPLTLNRTGVRVFGGDDSGVVGGTTGAASCCTTTGVDITVCPAVLAR